MEEKEKDQYSKDLEEAKNNLLNKDQEIQSLKSKVAEQEILLNRMQELESKVKEYEEKKVQAKKGPDIDAYAKEVESLREQIKKNKMEEQSTIEKYRDIIKHQMIKNTISKYDIKETTKDLLMQQLSQETALDDSNNIIIQNENGLPKGNELGSQLTLDDHINNIKKKDIDSGSFAFFKETKQISGEHDSTIGGPPSEADAIPMFTRDKIPTF